MLKDVTLGTLTCKGASKANPEVALESHIQHCKDEDDVSAVSRSQEAEGRGCIEICT